MYGYKILASACLLTLMLSVVIVTRTDFTLLITDVSRQVRQDNASLFLQRTVEQRDVIAWKLNQLQVPRIQFLLIFLTFSLCDALIGGVLLYTPLIIKPVCVYQCVSVNI